MTILIVALPGNILGDIMLLKIKFTMGGKNHEPEGYFTNVRTKCIAGESKQYTHLFICLVAAAETNRKFHGGNYFLKLEYVVLDYVYFSVRGQFDNLTGKYDHVF